MMNAFSHHCILSDICVAGQNFEFSEVKPMAQLVKNYNFGLPLNTIEELDNIERNLFTDDKYASSLVNN